MSRVPACKFSCRVFMSAAKAIAIAPEHAALTGKSSEGPYKRHITILAPRHSSAPLMHR